VILVAKCAAKHWHHDENPIISTQNREVLCMDVDGLTAAEPKRIRRVLLVVAAIIPLAAFVAGFAWFMRTYVVPPTLTAETVLASADPPMASPKSATKTEIKATEPQQPQVTVELKPAPEQPGAFPPPPRPAASAFASPPQPDSVFPTPLAPPVSADTPSTRSVAAATPAPEPQPATAVTPETDTQASLPITGPIPLPPRRPRFSLARVRGPVPLPKPRPSF
jgi:hypothetical protein